MGVPSTGFITEFKFISKDVINVCACFAYTLIQKSKKKKDF